MRLILDHSKSIYLRGSIPTLVGRLENEQDKRPLIATLDKENLTEFVAKHLFERRNFYEQAHFTIAIDQKSTGDIVKEISLLI